MRPHSLGVLSLVLVLIGVARASLNPYDLCGGKGYSGETECPSGYDCVTIDDYFSRCIKKGDYYTTTYNPPAYTTTHTPVAYTPPGYSSAYQPPVYTSVYTPPAYTSVYVPPVPYGYTSVYTPPVYTSVVTPTPYTPPGSSAIYTPPAYTSVYVPPVYTSKYTPPAGYSSVYTPPAYSSVYTPPAYTPPGEPSAYTPPAYTSAYTPPAYTSVYVPPYTSVYTPPAYTSVYTPPAYTPSDSSSPIYTPPAYTSVYTPPAYTSVYSPPPPSVYTPPVYTSVYTPPAYTPKGSSSPVYTPPAYTSVYTPPPVYYSNPPVYSSSTPTYYSSSSSSVYYSSSTPTYYSSSSSSVYYSSSTPTYYSSSSSSVYYSSSTPTYYSSSSSSVYYSSSTPTYYSSSSSVYYPSSSPTYYSSSSSSVYYSSSTPTYYSSSSSVYYPSSSPTYYSSSSSVYTPPPYTQVYTPPAYTPSGYSSAYTPKPYTSIYTPKPYVPPCETITSVYTPPAYTSVYTPPPYTPPGYSSAYTPEPYTSVHSPKPYTSVYTPPIAYTSVYTPPAYTSVYTPPVYTPSGSSDAYTPTAYTSVYTPPAYTSVYSPPPYSPPGYTSVETLDPYTSIYTPPPYTPPGSSSLYTPPPYTSVYTPPPYTSIYTPPVYTSSPTYSPTYYSSSSSSVYYSSPTYSPTYYSSSSSSVYYSSPTYSPTYYSSSSSSVYYSSPTYSPTYYSSSSSVYYSSSSVYYSSSSSVYYSSSVDTSPTYTTPITTYTTSSIYLPTIVYTSSSVYTSVAYPTVALPSYTSYAPPSVSSYIPDTQEPTYTPANPYVTTTSIIIVTPTATASTKESLVLPTGNGFTPVVGAPGLETRYPVDELQTNYPDVWNIFLWALYDWQASDESTDLSYYQISGIHGLPHIPWQYPVNPATQDPTRGYCTHSSALFATWHRPYLILVEQTLYAHAQSVALKFTGPEAQKYQDAAKKVRLPYWDWSSDSTKSHLPTSVTVETVTIVIADASGAATTTTIPNPLYSYTFKNQQYRDTYFDAGFFRDTDHTCRQPDANGLSRNDLADQGMANTYDSRRQSTYNLFSIPTFQGFSSNAWDGGGAPNAWTSVENIHNDVHAITGGSLGHMSYVDYAAFDPIFWFHHCNIDRLTAMYQAAWPGNDIVPQAASGTFARKVGPNDVDDINTPLYPFRHEGGNEWTSKDISNAQDIYTYGYAYPEVPANYKGQSSDQLKLFTIQAINNIYRPPLSTGDNLTPAPAGGVVRQEWVAHIAYDQSEIIGQFIVLVFVGDIPEKVTDWQTASQLIGQCATFGDDSSTMSHVIKGSVPLTQTLIDNHIGLDAESVVPYLKANLHWVIKQGGYSLPLSSLKTLTVGISSTQVAYADDYTQLAHWGEAETHYDITDGQEGGLQTNQTYLVNSIPAPPIVNSTDSYNHTVTRRYVEFTA